MTYGTAPVTSGSRHQVKRVLSDAQAAPESAQRLAAVLLLARGRLVGLALLPVLLIVAAIGRRLAPRSLADVQALDAHALRLQRVLELVEAVAQQPRRLVV